MALLVKADGTREEIEIPQSDESQLGYLQGLVGGYIQMVPALTKEASDEGYTEVVCSEEGKIKGYAYNDVATKLAGRDGSQGFKDPLVGDCLFIKAGEVT